MKRDWLLIRKLLHQEPTDAWSAATVAGHKRLCLDRNLFDGLLPPSVDGDISILNDLTLQGVEMREALANEADLVAVLDRLDRAGVGSPEAIVLQLMAEIAQSRIRDS